MTKQIQTMVLVAAALVLSGGGFVAGMTVGPTLGNGEGAKAQQSAAPNAAGGGRRQVAGGAAQGAAGAGQLVGQVISVNDGSITIETRQPGGDTTRSVIALVGGDARVVRNTEVDIKLADIKPGDQVIVVGTTDQATGTVNANAVVVGVNALQQLFGGGAGRPGSGGQFAPNPSGSPRVRPSASPRP